jgi:nickel-type superoxide dismutase maturation protease
VARATRRRHRACYNGGVADRRWGWGVAVARGRSMEPTLHDGDRLLVRWFGGEALPAPAPGSVVVVRLPGGRPVAVKRLLARRPEGWWVERDNPAEGVDSWQVGAVADDGLLGVVRWRVWPRPGRLPPAPARPAP